MHNLQRVKLKRDFVFRNTVITSSAESSLCKLAFPTAVVCLCVFITHCCVQCPTLYEEMSVFKSFKNLKIGPQTEKFLVNLVSLWKKYHIFILFKVSLLSKYLTDKASNFLLLCAHSSIYLCVGWLAFFRMSCKLVVSFTIHNLEISFHYWKMGSVRGIGDQLWI